MLVWIDLENAPHALFFRPITRALQRKGHEVFVTARDFGQTLELAAQLGMTPVAVGRSNPASGSFGKAVTALRRAYALTSLMRRRRPSLALSHGSRGQTIAARALRVPSYSCFDYDYSETRLFHWCCRHVFVPEETLENFQRVKRVKPGLFVPYPGIKEEVYLEDWRPKQDVLGDLGLDPSCVIAVLRAPGTLAHYASERTDVLFEAVLERLLEAPNVRLVMLPRYQSQRGALQSRFADDARVIFPETAIDTISLMAAADIVVSGGGTMAREAAVLGVPTYSVFAGPEGTIDKRLEAQGRLVLIREPAEAATLPIRKKPMSAEPMVRKKGLADDIVDRLLELHAGAGSSLERSR